jgi:dienelactone hydrolase
MRRLYTVFRLPLALAVALAMLVAGCSSGATDTTLEAATPTTSTAVAETAATSPPTTTILAPSTTTTTVDVPPTLPPEMEPKYSVVMTEGLSGPDTQEIVVWAPDAAGPWPVVMFLAGWEGKGIHYAQTAEMLAGQGVVVFAPDYRSKDIVTAEWKNPYSDAECAYRHIRTVASEYGGDIDQPITIAGHSLGASVAMAIVLYESQFGPEGPFDRCPEQVPPRPDQVVGLAGCHLKSGVDGTELPFTPKASGWTHYDAAIHLAVGNDDTVCEPWQSEEAAATLTTDGYENVELTVIDDADHFDVMFTGYRGDNEWYEPGGEWFAKPNDSGGVAAVQTILNTIATNS